MVKLAERAGGNYLLLGRSAIDSYEPEGAGGCQDEAALKLCIMEDLKAKGEKPTPPKVQRIYKGITAKREIEATLQAVKHAGGHAEYIPVDITCQPDLAGEIGRAGPPPGPDHGHYPRGG